MSIGGIMLWAKCTVLLDKFVLNKHESSLKLAITGVRHTRPS